MKTTLYRSETRGHEKHGWLDARHTFSFANYYDPNRIHFGALRVLNDDIIEGGKGFGTHGHDNMEIITIPLEGNLHHQDSLGHGGVIKTGDVQVMSAGSGIKHSEYNGEKNQDLNLFQIWVFPNKKNVQPRYQQKTLDFWQKKNFLHEIVTPEPTDHALWIHQDAWFSIGEFDKDKNESYQLRANNNGVFVMVIEGSFNVAGIDLNRRDGLGISDIDQIEIKSLTDNARILLMEVPMQI